MSIEWFIKKRFQHHFTVQSSNSLPSRNSRSVQGDPSSEQKIETLINESEALKVRAENAEKQNVTLRNTIEVLEEKSQKVEENMYKELKKTKVSLDKSFEDEKVLKGVLKKQSDDNSQHKSEISSMSKVLKSKAKEIHNLETKIENQNQTITNLKNANSGLKSDHKKPEKKIKESIKLAPNKSSLKCSDCHKSFNEKENSGHVGTSHLREVEKETSTSTLKSNKNEAEPPATPVEVRKLDECVTEDLKTFKCNECLKNLTSECL